MKRSLIILIIMIKREIIQRYDDIVKELQMDESILRTIDMTLEHYINQLKMNRRDY